MRENEHNIQTLKRGDRLTLNIEKAAFEGKTISRLGDFVVFIEGAVPGDLVEVEIFRKRKRYAEARVVSVVTPSQHRVEPACGHFGVCGGCRWQHMDYEEQLRWKREHVLESFAHVGGLGDVTVHPTLAAEDVFFYRNKMEYSFGEKRWHTTPPKENDRLVEPAFALGLHVPRRYDKILHVDRCYLQSETSNEVLAFTRDFFLAHDIRAYSTKTHSGELRHLVIREGKNTGQRMVYLVTSPMDTAIVDEYAREVVAAVPDITTVVHGVTTRKSMVAQTDENRVLFGPGIIEETLGGCRYEISPSSFFQSNTRQAEKLYAVTLDYAGVEADTVVWDLYCGIGTIALFFARHAGRVVGVELNPDAVEDARRNAARNGVENCEFVASDIVEFLASAAAVPDVVVIDPPRSGLHPKVVKGLGTLPVSRLVYVSCNPVTCARDVKMLGEYGFRVQQVQPVDMFPHTYHIECVVTLRRDQP